MKRFDYVERALEEIPAEERVAIELAYFDEHTYIEVARDPQPTRRDDQEPHSQRDAPDA